MTFVVGEQVWWVKNRYLHRDAEDGGISVTVEKVGRKWVTLSNGYRVSLHSGDADGGKYSSPGSVYQSQEAYVHEMNMGKAWKALKQRIEKLYVVPSHFTETTISELERMMFPDRAEVPHDV